MSLAKWLEPDWAWAKVPNEQLPLTSVETMVSFAVAYLVIITVGTHLMQGVKPFRLNWFTIPWNIVMCIYSGWTFLAFFDIFWTVWKSRDFDLFVPICDPTQEIVKAMTFWSYLFYLSKFLEFVDSFVLVLKGKRLVPPENSQFFLHVFHHTTTASIVWVTIFMPVTMGWIGPVTNSFVHFFMYGYYALVELHLIPRAWGGKFITPIQLVQFVVCLLSVIYETVNYKVCRSNGITIAWLDFTYIVFLYFFVQVFNTKKVQRTTPVANGTKDKKA